MTSAKKHVPAGKSVFKCEVHGPRGDIPSDPYFCRIIPKKVIGDDWRTAKAVLNAAAGKYPCKKPARFLVTPAGFVGVNLDPASCAGLTGDSLRDRFLDEAEKTFDRVFDAGLRAALTRVSRYSVVGFDSNTVNGKAVELMVILENRAGKAEWTGKSYPVNEKERKNLFLQDDFKTHFVRRKGLNLMLLLCFDQMMMINRGKKTATVTTKKLERRRFQGKAQREKPDCVIHVAHTTDTWGTWSSAVGAMNKTVLGYDPAFGSAAVMAKRMPATIFDDILRRSANRPTVDFVVG